MSRVAKNKISRNTFKRLLNLTVIFTDSKGRQQSFVFCSDIGGWKVLMMTPEEDKLKALSLVKIFLNIKLEDCKLKGSENYKMTVKGLKDDLYLNFKYSGS